MHSDPKRVPRKGIFYCRELTESRETIGVDKQCIIRFPHQVAAELAKRLSNSTSLGLVITPTAREDYRLYNVSFQQILGDPTSEIHMTGVLVELPAHIESFKTIDSDMFFKSADVSQMIIVTGYNSNDHFDLTKLRDENHWEWKSGLTPATNRIASRKFRNFEVFERSEIMRAEKELIDLLRGNLKETISVEMSNQHELETQVQQMQSGLANSNVYSVVGPNERPFDDAASDLSEQLFMESGVTENAPQDWNEIAEREAALLNREDGDSSNDESVAYGLSSFNDRKNRQKDGKRKRKSKKSGEMENPAKFEPVMHMPPHYQTQPMMYGVGPYGGFSNPHFNNPPAHQESPNPPQKGPQPHQHPAIHQQMHNFQHY